MNNIRIPIALLIIAVIAFGAWLFFAHQAAAPAPTQQTTEATTTAPVVTQTTQQPTLNPTPALSVDAVASNITGVWQSTDDSNYSVNITPNGKWTDEYKQASATSTISETGDYTFFTSANPDPSFPGSLQSGVVYIKLIEGSDIYFYSMLQVTNDQLQLSYLARGNTLSFVRKQ